jgi:hypothetical protein
LLLETDGCESFDRREGALRCKVPHCSEMRNLTQKVPSFVEVAILLGQRHAPHIVEKIYRYFYDVKNRHRPPKGIKGMIFS